MRRALLVVALSLVSCHAHRDPRWPGWRGRTCKVRFATSGALPRQGLALIAIEGDQARLLEAEYHQRWTTDVPPYSRVFSLFVRERHRYDARGRPVESVSARSGDAEHVRISYDDQGRTTARELAARFRNLLHDTLEERTERCTFGYDHAGRLTRLAIARRKGGQPAEVHESWHPHLGPGESVEPRRHGATHAEQHDDRGRRIGTEVYWDGRRTYGDRYQWDEAGRLQIWFRDQPPMPPWHERYERDAAGRVVRRIHSSGDVLGAYTYDGQGRPATAINGSRVTAKIYAHDGSRTAEFRSYLATATTTFEYNGCDPFPGAAALLVDQHMTPSTPAQGECELQAPTLPLVR